MLKIAVVSEHASPLAAVGGVDSGGQNIYVYQIAEQLARRGHQVDVFTRCESPSQQRIITMPGGWRVVHVPAGPARVLPKECLLAHMPAFSAYLDSVFTEARLGGCDYNVVHANFFMSGLAALPVVKRLHIPFAITFHALGRVRRMHQGEADGFPDARFDIEAEIVREADRIIAECPQDICDLMALYNADRSRISMIPCGYDPGEMSPLNLTQARTELGWQHSVFTILQLGRMVPRKGVDTVIDAISRLKRQHGISARLYVVGGNAVEPCEVTTPEIGRLRGIAKKLGVDECVTFTGRRDRLQLRAYYCAADVFVTTPWYEPFGITPLEAMACARPVIGSDTGGIRHTVVHGETGFLVAPKDADDLAEKLAVLAASPALRRRLGEAGAVRAKSQFTWASVASALEEAFISMIPQTSRVRARPNADISDGLRAIA